MPLAPRTLANRAQPSSARLFSTCVANAARNGVADSNAKSVSSPNPRWLTDLRDRMARCLSRPLAAADAKLLRERLDYLDTHWLRLLAGREGFLTGDHRKGLYRHSVAWGDMDSMGKGHVNNAMYNRYAESGRVNWITSFASKAGPENQQQWIDLMTPKSVGLIMRSFKVDYKLPVSCPDQITVLHKLAEEPDYSSDGVVLEAIIFSERHRRPAARCFEDIAVYDYREARKTTLKGFMVDSFRETYELQQSRREEIEREVGQIHQMIQEVEDKAAPDAGK